MIKISAWRGKIIKDEALSSRFPLVAIVITLLLAGGLGILAPFMISVISRAFPATQINEIGTLLGTFGPAFWALMIGVIIMAILIILRLDALAITIVLAIHLYFDWYLGFGLVAQVLELALLLIYFFERSPQHPWAVPRALWLWALFIGVSIIPATYGITLSDTLNYYFNIIFGSLTMLWLGTIIARNRASVHTMFSVLAGFGTLIAIHVIIQATTGRFLLGSTRYDPYFALIGGYYHLVQGNIRAGSFLINPDGSGTFFAVMLFIPLALFVESTSTRAKLLYLAEMFLMLIALLFTYSTGGWIAACVGMIAFIAFVGSRRYRFQIPLFILIAVIIIFVSFPGQVSLQLQHAFFDPSDASDRIGAWKTGLAVIRAFPLTGIGIGRYVYYYRADPYLDPSLYNPISSPHNDFAHPHDSYIEIGALAGIPVLIFFMALLAFNFWLTMRNWSRADAPTRSLLAGGIAAIVSLSANSVGVNGWTLIPVAAIAWLVYGVISSPLLAENLDREAMKEKNQVKNGPPGEG